MHISLLSPPSSPIHGFSCTGVHCFFPPTPPHEVPTNTEKKHQEEEKRAATGNKTMAAPRESSGVRKFPLSSNQVFLLPFSLRLFNGGLRRIPFILPVSKGVGWAEYCRLMQLFLWLLSPFLLSIVINNRSHTVLEIVGHISVPEDFACS